MTELRSSCTQRRGKPGDDIRKSAEETFIPDHPNIISIKMINVQLIRASVITGGKIHSTPDALNCLQHCDVLILEKSLIKEKSGLRTSVFVANRGKKNL